MLLGSMACTRTESASPPAAVFDGEAISAAVAPPPVSGGTLALVAATTSRQVWIVASVPEADSVHVVGMTRDGLGARADVKLAPGDEPARVIGDASGRAHVTLRGAGDLVTIDPASATILARRHVCDAPRGLAYDPVIDAVHVACANGELVTLPAAGGDVTRRVVLDRDLRDVVVLPAPALATASPLLVSRFRSAEILSVDVGGAIVRRFAAPSPFTTHVAHVAWRMVPTATGATVTFQVATTSPIDLNGSAETGAYGGGGGPPIVAPVVAQVDAAGFGPLGAGSIGASSPNMDLAIADDGSTAVAAGSSLFVAGSRLRTSTTAFRQVTSVAFGRIGGALVLVSQWRGGPSGREGGIAFHVASDGSWLERSDWAIALPGIVDTGLDIFQSPTSNDIACASCHPEGGDDGHTWTFTMEGGSRVRRTMSLRGGILGAAPFHWDADIADTRALCDVIFSKRMGGGNVTAAQVPVVEHFLNAIPRLPPRAGLDAASVDAGRALFTGKGTCSSCHTGDQLTSTQRVDVGKDTPLKVGRLVNIGDRAPFMHDGCAATLLDRFDPACGGACHGAQDLTDAEKHDLVQYMETL
jgi:hypothetical protein